MTRVDGESFFPMESNHSQIPDLLRNNHLFRKLSEADLLALADQFEASTVGADSIIFKQGDRGDSFYIVMEGKVRVIREQRRTERELAVLVRGDYFGEEALVTHRQRSATVQALTDVTLLRLTQEQFNYFVRRMPHLRDNFKVSIESRRLSRVKPLEWLNPGEVVYVMARRNRIFLYIRLILPGFALLGSLILFYYLYFDLLPGMDTGKIIGGLAIAVSLFWLVWNDVDWGNDYFIVTNQRVVRLEVVVGLYDSRTEAPLNTVLSVGIDTDQIGRFLGYGNVLVRTFTGPILLHHVAHPDQVASMVEEYWQRAKTTAKVENEQAIQQAIRDRLKPHPITAPKPPPPPRKPSMARRVYASLFSDFIKVRIDQEGSVTYRKHWYVLVRKIWQEGVLLLAILAFLAIRLPGVITFPSLGATIALVTLIGIIDLAWFLYDYQDWRNDIYRVTADQVIDIEKKPFSTEQKKSAPLESILSIEYERMGFLGVLLNFGIVKITVGGTKFDFYYVYNPSQVQQDIFRRMEERKVKKAQAEAAAERERLSEWIVAYHRSIGPGAAEPPAPPDVSSLPPEEGQSGEEPEDEAYY